MGEDRIWISEITGRTYSSERRMRAAEAASIRMKRKIDERLLEKAEAKAPIRYTSLRSARNRWTHLPGGIMNDLFYEIQGNWDILQKGTMTEYYRRYGMDTTDIQGRSLRDFIKKVLGVGFYDN